MNLVNGKIDFTDLFVKPNYSADLSELTGKLSAFSSEPAGRQAGAGRPGTARQGAADGVAGDHRQAQSAGQAAGTRHHRARCASSTCRRCRPIRCATRAMASSAASSAWTSTTRSSPTASSTATNKLVLNQLQFGDEVEGAPNSLPVRLAVALLADRNGVIDIDFPISGSLNDPQFSIGPLIFKAIGNLVVKAVTAPFSLLTGGLGGGGGRVERGAVRARQRRAVDRGAAKAWTRSPRRLTERRALRHDGGRHGQPGAGARRLPSASACAQMAQAEKRRAAARGDQDAADGRAR